MCLGHPMVNRSLACGALVHHGIWLKLRVVFGGNRTELRPYPVGKMASAGSAGNAGSRACFAGMNGP